MRKTEIAIFKNSKNPDNCYMEQKQIYKGECVITERYSIHERRGGVDSGNSIRVRIFCKEDIPVSCGDMCILDGVKRTVKAMSKCIEGVSLSFRHIMLELA